MQMAQETAQWDATGALAVSGHHLLPNVTLPAEWARIVRIEDLDAGITIGCWQGSTERGFAVEAKGPAMFCIGVMLEGTARMALDEGPQLELTSGMAVVQTANRPVSGRFVMDGGAYSRLVDIRFTPEALLRSGGRPLAALQGQFLKDCSLPHLQSLMGGFPAPVALLRVASDILACDFEDGVVRSLYLHAKSLEALAIVLQTLSATAPLQTRARERAQLLRARRLLDDRFEEDWTLPRLAREVGLGEKKLQAGFRAMAGRSVHEHLREVRLSAASALLTDGASVTEAATAAGFASLSHFTKAFKQSRGVLPRDWIRAHRI